MATGTTTPSLTVSGVAELKTKIIHDALITHVSHVEACLSNAFRFAVRGEGQRASIDIGDAKDALALIKSIITKNLKDD